jgi:hypothetical protein
VKPRLEEHHADRAGIDGRSCADAVVASHQIGDLSQGVP